MEAKDFLEKYRPQIEEELHRIAKNCLQMPGSESKILFSPRWVNIGREHFDNKDGTCDIQLRSSQGTCGFFLTVDKGDLGSNWFFLSSYLWDAFKEFRTEFLLENYPEIKTY